MGIVFLLHSGVHSECLGCAGGDSAIVHIVELLVDFIQTYGQVLRSCLHRSVETSGRLGVY